MSKQLILVVEDEAPIRSMLRYALELNHYEVEEAEDGNKALLLCETSKPSLIILDWMLPRLSGIEFTKRIRGIIELQNIPIIMLTAKADEESKVQALEVGADDYIVKPFSPAELIARVKAVLRRGPIQGSTTHLQFGNIKIDSSLQMVEINGREVKLGRLEYRMLFFLMTHCNRVFSRDELLTHVWGSDKYLDERTVDVHIRRLRKRLSPFGYSSLIETVHGTGYRISRRVQHDG